MAISFKESISAIRCENEQPTSVKRAMIASQSVDDWTLDNRYEYYADYSDTSFSCIDASKNIILDSKQINLTQEINSQFIPFEMPRYYDGFDLTNTRILIHFVNRDRYEDYDSPVNVSYSDEKIRFAWLVDNRVTAVDGVVKFEIQAIGSNSAGEDYIWKTKPSDGLNILKSLEGEGVIEPDSSWITNFMSQIADQVSLAKRYADEAKAAAELAGSGGNGGSVSITLDKTLTIEGQAADAKAVGDAISELPIKVANDKYTDIASLRKPISIAFIKSGSRITATTILQGNRTSTSTVSLNDNGRPSAISTDGVECVVTWDGFDS